MKKLVMIAAVALTALSSQAQSELPEYAADKKKVLKKVKLDMPLEGRKYKNGTGYSLNPKTLKKMPKRVALVSFYGFDPGMTKVHSYTTTGTTYKTTVTHTTKLSSKGVAGMLALGFYLQSIDEMRAGFKDAGVELLTPSEFLTDDTKRTAYENFQVGHTKFNDFARNMGSANHDQVYATLGDYQVLDVVNEPYANYTKKGLVCVYKPQVSDNQVWVMAKDGKMCNSMGSDLCKALDVDAVVAVYFTLYVPKKGKIMLQNVNMHMFGPNPTPLKEGKTKKFNYFEGQFYCGTRLNTALPIWKPSKKDPSTNELDFRGFEVVMQAMTQKMCDYLQDGIAAGK